MMKKIKYLSLGCCCLLLLGCDGPNKARIESVLNSNKDSAICFSYQIPNSYYPLDIVNIPEPNYLKYDYKQSHRALSLFSQMGLLKEEKLFVEPLSSSDFVEAYRYTPTEEGKKYTRAGGICFGNIAVDEITKSENIEYIVLGTRMDTGKRFYYTYSFIDIPEWAKSPELAKIYDIKLKFDGRLYNHSAVTSNNKQTLSTSIDATFYFNKNE